MLFSTLSKKLLHAVSGTYAHPPSHCAFPPPYCGPSVLNRNSTISTLKNLPSINPLLSFCSIKTPPNPLTSWNPIKHHQQYPPKQPSCTLSRCIGTMTSSTSHFVTELFGPRPFTWKTPAQTENIRTPKSGFCVPFFVPDLMKTADVLKGPETPKQLKYAKNRSKVGPGGNRSKIQENMYSWPVFLTYFARNPPDLLLTSFWPILIISGFRAL